MIDPPLDETIHKGGSEEWWKQIADRRLRLMQKQDKKIKVCQFCFHHLKWDGNEKKMIGHYVGCEWGKEIRGE